MPAPTLLRCSTMVSVLAIGCHGPMDSPPTSPPTVVSVAPQAVSPPSSSATAHPDNVGPSAIDAITIPLTGNAPEQFVPQGWVLQGQVSGLIDADTQPDLAMWLIHKWVPGATEKRRRAFVVLLGAAGGWRRVGLSTNLLQCRACEPDGGGLDPPIEVQIYNHEVMVVQADLAALREFRLRWDAQAGRVALSRSELRTRDRTGVVDTVEVTWNGTQRLEKTSHGSVPPVVSTKTTAASWIWLEEVKPGQTM